MKTFGSSESLDVRRAQALGCDRPPAAGVRPQRHRRRELCTRAEAAAGRPACASLRGRDPWRGRGLGRFENTRTPITIEQIRDWCGNPDAQVVVKPVIDLNDHHHVNAYEVPTGSVSNHALINPTCVFPWCTRSARRCDSDHIQPYDAGGTTSIDNIAPLCSDTTALKTHGGWTTDHSSPAPISGPAPTATPTSATSPAPSTSAATNRRRRLIHPSEEPDRPTPR